MSVPLHLVERLAKLDRARPGGLSMREARLILAALGRVCPLQPQSAICYLLSVIALKARWFARSLAANRKVVVEANFCIQETAISERRAA